MKIQLLVDAEVNFVSGKFAPRDEIVEQLQEACSDPGTISAGEGEYEVSSFEVTEYDAEELTRLRIRYYTALKELHDRLSEPRHTMASLNKLKKAAAKALGIKEPTNQPKEQQ